MLKALLVRDFQRHKRLEVRFDPAITTIKGGTDRGKSAIIRALRWVVVNSPSGEAFIRHEQDTAIVGLSVDGHVITRRRGKGGNLYKLDGTPFKAFGDSVPDDIAKVLKMSALNFQAQHDSPFWFSDGPTEVSKKLNEVIDLSIIDEALTNVARKVRHNKTVVDVTEERLEAARAEVKECAFAVELDVDLRKAETLQDQLTDLSRNIDTLTELLDAAHAAQAAAETKLPDFTVVDKLVAQWADQRVKAVALQLLIDDAHLNTKAAERAKVAASQAEDELHKHTKGRCPVCGGKFNA